MTLFGKKRRIYLDYAAATPVRREVRRAMEAYVSNMFANPSAIFEEGRRARAALETARTDIARALHAGARDVVFTSGGTESDNLAILGTYEYAREKIARPHIIVTEHEHPAILEAAREAERRGAELSVVPMNEIVQHIRENTVLVSLSLCNSETGEIAPASKIGRAVRETRKLRESEFPYIHLDASQAVVTLDVHVDTLRADLLTLDAGKIYGPKGVGALIVRPWVHIRPVILGGGQERGLRSGTENVPGIIGFAEALTILTQEREKNGQKLTALKEHFLTRLEKDIPSARVNGTGDAVSNVVSITIPGSLHEFLAIALAERGVCVSTGSSCSSHKNEPEKEALRFSFSPKNSLKEVTSTVRDLKEILL